LKRNRFYNQNKNGFGSNNPDWLTVSEGKKEAMWQLLRKTFILPRGTKDKVKHYARNAG
jgi:hypothetical protein